MQDVELLKQLDALLPIRARLVCLPGGGKGHFELTDRNDRNIEIPVSALRVIAVLRRNNYPEAFDETNAFDG